MKALILSFVILACTPISFSQLYVKFNTIIRDTLVTEKYEERDEGFKVQYLDMSPGSWRIKNETAANLLRKETIVAIDLVYSDFPEGDDFSELNRRRLIELYSALPEAFNRQVVSWRIVKQTGVKSSSDMERHFHGFAVYYRPMPSNYAENKLIEDIVSGKVSPEDSTILKVFERNKDWKDMLVVCDVTGSMSPYTAQLLLWIKANQKLRSMKNILFFNDDDEKSTNQKTKKDTSGTWFIASKNYEEVMKVALSAMKGGDQIENNLEAVCRAIEEFPDNKKNVIMIADNWEDPCDMHLLKYLRDENIPIRIIICGVNASINTNYLEIARVTGGSIHTMEEDLFDLASMKNGTTFKIGDTKIKLHGGKFFIVN